MVADAWVRADTLAHALDVGAEPLGEVGDFAHEADLGGEHGVGGVLGQFRRTRVHEHQLVVVAVVGRVALAHQAANPVGIGADDDAGGACEVLERAAFLEKLRVGADVEVEGGSACRLGAGDAAGNQLDRADRHRRLVDHHLVAVDVGPDGSRDGEDVGKVGRAVLAGRRADGVEDQRAEFDGGTGVGGEGEAALLDIAADDVLEAGLEDRHDAVGQTLDLRRVDIDAGDLVADIGEAGASHQADVTRSENGDLHGVSTGSIERGRHRDGTVANTAIWAARQPGAEARWRRCRKGRASASVPPSPAAIDRSGGNR